MNIYISLLVISALIGLGISYSALYFFHVTVLLILLIYSFSITKKFNEFTVVKQISKMHIPVIVMFCWYFLSILWVENLIDYMKYMFYLMCGVFIIFFVLFQVQKENIILKIYTISLYTISLQVIVSFLEIISPFRWPISPFSKYVVFFNRPYSFEHDFSSFQLTYLNSLPTGFAWNPNNLAIIMLIFFPLFLMFNRKNAYMKIITFLMPLIILMSGSRASVIGLLIILVVYLLYKKNIKLLLLSILIITVVNMSEHILDEELYYKYEEILSLINIFDDIKNSRGSENSLGVRNDLVSNGIEALIDSYGLGVGAGNSLEVQRQVGSNILSMHNIWIELLVEGGILFFVFFVIWYMLLIIKLMNISWRNKNQTGDLAFGLVLAFIGFIPGAISASSVIYILPIWVVLCISLTLLNVKEIDKKTKDFSYYKK